MEDLGKTDKITFIANARVQGGELCPSLSIGGPVDQIDQIDHGKITEEMEGFLSSMKALLSPFLRVMSRTANPVPQSTTDHGVCPDCGEPLALKHQTKDPSKTFIGCTGFKTSGCRYIKKS